jgi:hypothetical protein
MASATTTAAACAKTAQLVSRKLRSRSCPPERMKIVASNSRAEQR